ncbi:TrmB family transcriptional regulator [Paenibacillus profundus]|uniref:TrmB family transcriptional regulator n=1 Tax=Paenibacillus profundus TaxID=1173085 RepID=A0ABS8YCT9_9BACL|nr:TrmB family transcriptional regulator [Paenibacillus profundus]MCE5169049.1 TrmB family transcriptional regulator [Paenibacillus profundus]
MDEIVAELHKLGFSQYEAKAYVGLLKTSPITGYEISKRSGVPRSMIYEVLGKLLDKGAIYTVPSEPVKYAPVPAAELMNRLRKSYEQSFDYLEHALSGMESEREVDVIWHVRSDQRVIDEMIDMIENAKEELWLSVWEPQVPPIQSAIQQRVQAGASVFSIVFGAPEIELGNTYHHNYMTPDVVEQRMGGHLTIVSRDGEEVLIASFSDHAPAWAVKTCDPALVLVATEYIRHDIMVEEVTREYGPERLDRLWRTKPDLVHVVTGLRFNAE